VYAVGTCAEEIYFGLIKAKDCDKRLIILYPFDIPWLFRFKLTNRALFSIESSYIYKPNWAILFAIRFFLTMVYIPLRLYTLIARNLFGILVSESFSIPRIGIYDLFVPGMASGEFSFDVVIQHDWKEKFGYRFDFIIGGYSKGEIQALIERMGIPRDAWFVCIHVRENGFRNDKGRREYRNSDIKNYIPAIQEITSRGGWVVRMGDNTMTPLPVMEGVFDYPFSNFKSDLMDLCLIKNCCFYIGCQSGTYDIAKMFNKPVLLLNMYNWTFGGPLHTEDRGIVKHVFSKNDNRYLSVKELFSGGWEIQDMNGYVDDYVFFENTKEEILSAVIEYLSYLENNCFPVSDIQKMAVDCLRKHGRSIVENNRLTPAGVTNDDEELVEKYRIASNVIGACNLLCESYLSSNWEEDILNREVVE
jgi:putative glycosyltransferase (TIGR04372 family)